MVRDNTGAYKDTGNVVHGLKHIKYGIYAVNQTVTNYKRIVKQDYDSMIE